MRMELDAQYRELREEAGWAARARAVIEVAGPDAAEFLQSQLSNDVEALEPGQGCYATLLDRKGHLRADMRVLRREDEPSFLLDTEPECGPLLVQALTMYSVGRDVQITDAAAEWAVLSFAGPRSRELTGAVGLAAEHANRQVEAFGAAAFAVATPEGVDLFVKAEDEPAVRAGIAGAGVPEVDEAALEILRVEAGRPRFGRDMDAATMPAEAGIVERAVSFTKGCYVGQETVARLHYKGRPNRVLRGLRLSAPAAPGDPVTLSDREVGTVGTVALSPAVGAVALAVLRREAEPGAEVAVGAARAAATVAELPLVEPG